VQLAQEEVIAHIDMFTNVSSGIYSYHDTWYLILDTW
jgi:hypothetical protein